MTAVEDPLQVLSARLRECEHEVEGLETALGSRHVIGMAQGMLMVKFDLDQDRAFEFLSRTSQDQNVKLRHVAKKVIAEIANHTVEQ